MLTAAHRNPEIHGVDESELGFFGGFLQRLNRAFTSGDTVHDPVKIAGPHEFLMGNGHVPVFFAMRELFLLEFGVCLHALFAITERQLEHAQIKRMKTGQGDKLKPVSHGAQLSLKGGDLTVVQVALPVK